MGGFFGTALKRDCVTDLYYGTDYNSHLGTKRGGMATYDPELGFVRSIHSLESTYFRTKFENVLPRFKGCLGIGVISDNDSQPIVVNSHLGKFAIVTVAKIQNMDLLETEMLAQHVHFAETSSGNTNPTEMVATLINDLYDFTRGIRYA
ncbi:MAG: amidophosphoribosyltransferase, partial [Muribaculaceae bacterium]|nr:amidophosphoribosyltransferase [Muribaculaceae bacterium]